jgi:alkanesulfonate monooxygenase SsuD/methylene tetrahydromethanopterin reductase-like flavin-dependent oxidoreductase (luciferase family)
MVREWTAAGTPDECIEQLRDVIDQGATEITLRCTSFDQAGQFERLVAEVLPAFR